MSVWERSKVVSSYTIVKGSMLQEAYAACRHWDLQKSNDENFAALRHETSIPAKSTSWRNDVCKVLHRRFDLGGLDQPLVILAQGGCSYDLWKPVYLWHMTRDEYLVRDFLCRFLFPEHQDGALKLRSEDVIPYLKSLGLSGRYTETWTDHTTKRVAAGLLRMAVDFDLMTGSISRDFVSYHMPDQAFLYLLHASADTQPNAREIIAQDDWKMYLMDRDDVEQRILRLHQFRELHYEVAGSVAQLSLPCKSALEYAQRMTA